MGEVVQRRIALLRCAGMQRHAIAFAKCVEIEIIAAHGIELGANLARHSAGVARQQHLIAFGATCGEDPPTAEVVGEDAECYVTAGGRGGKIGRGCIFHPREPARIADALIRKAEGRGELARWTAVACCVFNHCRHPMRLKKVGAVIDTEAQLTDTPLVVGSNPTGPTKLISILRVIRFLPGHCSGHGRDTRPQQTPTLRTSLRRPATVRDRPVSGRGCPLSVP